MQYNSPKPMQILQKNLIKTNLNCLKNPSQTWRKIMEKYDTTN
jgi:hypothetical protein